MKKLLYIPLIGLLALAPPVTDAGDFIDRIVANVNGQIILQSDWEEALAYQALVEHRNPGGFSMEEQQAALDRLIDQELIREQVRAADFRHATRAEIDARTAEIRKQHAGAGNEEGWRATLGRYGLSESELGERVVVELDQMRAVDAHLRPSVQIDAHSVETYYRERLLPELRQTGAHEVPLVEVAPKIREILAQEKINDLLIVWLRNLRSESNIRTPFAPGRGAGGGGR